MTGYLSRRVIQLVLVLALGSVAVWGLIYAAPGSPEVAIAGADATQEQRDAVRERLGLDQPLPVQYASWVGNAVTGDLGASLTSTKPVTELLAERVPATMQLVVATVLLGLAIALPVGTIAALRPTGALARAANAYQILLLATPSFWLGIILIWVFGLRAGILPTSSAYVSFFIDPAEAIRNTILPAATLGLFMAAVLMRFVRAAVSDALGEPHIRAARARGASQRRVLLNHGLRNAAVPIVTVTGLQLGAFIGGTVVTESIFNYPGLGRLILDAVEVRDYPVVQGTLLFVVLSFAVINMVVDLIYALLDPRVRLA